MEEHAISTFKESYNALYISHLPYDRIQEIKRSLNNPVLEKLIDNLYVPKTYLSQYIQGPISVYKFKLDIQGVPKRSFYLFGEIHRETAGHCSDLTQTSITFPEYIKRLSESSSSFFDLYVETSMLRLSKPPRVGDQPINLQHYDFLNGDPIKAFSETIKSMIKSPDLNFTPVFKLARVAYPRTLTTSPTLDTIISEFSNCIQPSTRSVDEKCKILRIHTIDTRSSWMSEDINDILYYRVIFEILDMGRSESIKLHLLNRLDGKSIELLSKLIIGDKIAIQNILDIIINNPYTKKEFDKIEPGLQDSIRRFFFSKIQSLSDLTIVSSIKDLISDLKSESIRLGWSSSVSIFILAFLSYSMDIYCLSRIFKNHKVDNVYQPRQSMNVIVYSGFLHTDIYREFFKFIGIRETYQYKNALKKSCVKMFEEKKAEPPPNNEEEYWNASEDDETYFNEENYLWNVPNESEGEGESESKGEEGRSSDFFSNQQPPPPTPTPPTPPTPTPPPQNYQDFSLKIPNERIKLSDFIKAPIDREELWWLSNQQPPPPPTPTPQNYQDFSLKIPNERIKLSDFIKAPIDREELWWLK